MKKVYCLFLLLVMSLQVYSQQVSNNNFKGNWGTANTWTAASTWSKGTPLTTGIAGYNVDIYGYVTSNSTLQFGNDGQTHSLTVFDTLVVNAPNATYAMDFGNQAMDLKVPSGGLLIVFGNFNAVNKITVENGGTFIVTGDMEFSNSGHDSFSQTGTGALYVGGEVLNNESAGGVDKELSEIPDKTLRDFVTSGGITPLPVNLLYFTATAQTNAVEINWAASKAWDFSHYELERSRNGQNFEYIATIDAEENTDYLTEFSYTDRQPLSGTSYYRLKAVDIDGRFEYKNMAVVQFVGGATVKVYPNPSTTGAIQVAVGATAEGATLSLKDHTGRTVFAQQMNNEKETISTKGLPAGFYILTVRTAGNTIQEQVIIK